MNEFDQSTIVALLADTDDGPIESVQAVQFHGLSALLTGKPADTQMISERSQLQIVDIEQGISALIDADRIELDGDTSSAVRRRWRICLTYLHKAMNMTRPYAGVNSYGRFRVH